MTRAIILLSLLMACTSCTEFAVLSSGAGIAVSHNTYAKAYSGIDFLTIINTEKNIKTHLYENIKKDQQ
tara:strand:+ start:44 stop:250 length:207 start_codon:yes stop_codon:yes gene_type:complete